MKEGKLWKKVHINQIKEEEQKNMASLLEKKAIFLNQEEKKDVKYYANKPQKVVFF